MATDLFQAPTSHYHEGPLWCLSLCLTCDPELLILFSTLLLHRLFVYFLQGKFIRINFDVAGYIVGANIETCILIPGLKVFSSSAVRLHLFTTSAHKNSALVFFLCCPFWLYLSLFMPAPEKAPGRSLLPTSNHKKKNI